MISIEDINARAVVYRTYELAADSFSIGKDAHTSAVYAACALCNISC